MELKPNFNIKKTSTEYLIAYHTKNQIVGAGCAIVGMAVLAITFAIRMIPCWESYYCAGLLFLFSLLSIILSDQVMAELKERGVIVET